MGHLEDTIFRSLAEERTDIDPFVTLQAAPARLDAVHAAEQPPFVVATFAGFDLDDCPMVQLKTKLSTELVRAKTIVALRSEFVGRETLVVFENGDVYQPIIVGLMQIPAKSTSAPPAPAPLVIHADDERYSITAEREIVLKCGDASITLTRAGKVIIKGTYILSRSSGYNKIKGAAVDIN